MYNFFQGQRKGKTNLQRHPYCPHISSLVWCLIKHRAAFFQGRLKLFDVEWREIFRSPTQLVLIREKRQSIRLAIRSGCCEVNGPAYGIISGKQSVLSYTNLREELLHTSGLRFPIVSSFCNFRAELFLARQGRKVRQERIWISGHDRAPILVILRF